MTIATIQKLIGQVEGFLTNKEGLLLFQLAKQVPADKCIVEIGSWKGKSTICLAAGAKSGNTSVVYAIDPHTGSPEHQDFYNQNVRTFQEFQANITQADLVAEIKPIIKKSTDALVDVTAPIGLLFIDGAHEYEAVKVDFESWFPKVADGGIIAFHDTVGWSGPKQVVEESLYYSRCFKNIKFVDSITYGQKINQNSLADRLINRYILCLRSGSEWVRGTGLPSPLKKVGKKVLEIVS